MIRKASAEKTRPLVAAMIRQKIRNPRGLLHHVGNDVTNWVSLPVRAIVWESRKDITNVLDSTKTRVSEKLREIIAQRRKAGA